MSGSDLGDFVVNMQSDIYLPAPFTRPLVPAELGPLYEIRTYTYMSGEIAQVMDAWGDAIEEREKYSPLVGAFYSDSGGSMNRWTHIWAYDSFEQRMIVREETRALGIWPPASLCRSDAPGEQAAHSSRVLTTAVGSSPPPWPAAIVLSWSLRAFSFAA